MSVRWAMWERRPPLCINLGKTRPGADSSGPRPSVSRRGSAGAERGFGTRAGLAVCFFISLFGIRRDEGPGRALLSRSGPYEPRRERRERGKLLWRLNDEQ
jgi:hypothetical protein